MTLPPTSKRDRPHQETGPTVFAFAKDELPATSVPAHLVDEEILRLARILAAKVDNPAAAAEEIGRQALADAAAWRDAFRLGYERGCEVGRRQAIAEIEQAEQRFAAHMSAITRMRTHAELELLRWGPGGRAHFGDRRETDYTGGAVRWEDE